jgi:hypothetical protein
VGGLAKGYLFIITHDSVDHVISKASARRHFNGSRLKISSICNRSFFVWLMTTKENRVFELVKMRHFFLSARRRFTYHGPRRVVSSSELYGEGLIPTRSIIFLVQQRYAIGYFCLLIVRQFGRLGSPIEFHGCLDAWLSQIESVIPVRE